MRAHRLWPRSLLTPALTANRRALTGSARVDEQAPSERIDVAFHGSREGDEAAGRTAA